MNAIVQWASNFWGGEKRQMADPRMYDLLVGSHSYAGPVVNTDTAMRYSAVYACVRIISESIASLPLVLYRRNGRNKERAITHPIYKVLHDMANPYMTAFEWRELVFAHVCLTGNHWSEVVRDQGTGAVLELKPLDPNRMEKYEKTNQGIRWLYRDEENRLKWYAPDDIHHVKGYGSDVLGISPIMQVARQATGLGLAAEEFGARFYSNNARPGLILRHPGKLTDKAAERLKASLAENAGAGNAYKTKVLEEGMDVTTIGIPPNEAQFLETRKFQITEIARIYRVPPHMLADLDRATFSNIEQQSINFVMHTLMPWLARHEQALMRDLLGENERMEYYPKYVVDGMLRGDTLSRYQAYTTAINTGFMTRNEARELEDWNTIDELDTPLMPLNMVEVGDEPPAPAQGSQPQRGWQISDGEFIRTISAWHGQSDVETRAAKASADRRALMNRNVRLFEEAASRVVKRETVEIRKQAKSKLGKRGIAEFEAWLESFYKQLREWFPDYFRNIMLTYAETIMASVAAELDGEPAPLDDELREWVEGYLANYTEVYAVGGEKQLRALLAESEGDEDAEAKINERMDGWDETKAGKEGFQQAFEAGNALAVYGYAAAGIAFLIWRARGDSCPMCKKMNKRKIPIKGSFFEAGDTLEAEGAAPMPIVRKIKHGPLHSGCDCVIAAG